MTGKNLERFEDVEKAIRIELTENHGYDQGKDLEYQVMSLLNKNSIKDVLKEFHYFHPIWINVESEGKRHLPELLKLDDTEEYLMKVFKDFTTRQRSI